MNILSSAFSSFLLVTLILFLASAGFFLILRTTKVFNVAHGDYLSLGAYLIWTFNSMLGVNIWISIIISAVVTGLVLILIDQLSFKYLRNASLAGFLCSIGVALIIRYSIFMIWGGKFKVLRVPMPNVEAFGTVASGSLLLMLAFGCIIFIVGDYLLKKTNLGMSIRAMADHRSLAESFGINTERQLKSVWFLAGCTATLAGVGVAAYQPLTYNLGFTWILLIFAVSTLAGEIISPARLLGACAIISGGMEVALFFLPEAYRMGIGFVILIIAVIVTRIRRK